ncbi:hypothetical protein Y032_0520g2857 [Ancylostoma ceylanicum]|uniref:Serine-threonine/tyrosine-protein kinase catalytic domain-containing protein n=1 Tax=Ancylostoma ceylanicum TaxID=53326 RepID=A0A016WSW3_9BILA|nr:hypothetical protein Y032_0520g2857 [Ancylostoma ceylanicum]
MTLARGDKLGRIPFTDEGIITSECAELQQLELLSKESPRAVLIYEIFAGTGPYEDMRNSVVKKMIVEGKLNKFPSDTPDDVVTFVNEKLWCKDPDKRPDFASIVGTLEKLVAAHADKVPEAPEDKSLVMASEGKTTATVDLDVPDVKKAAAKKAATEPKSSVTEVGDKKAGPTSEDATSKEGTKKPADATKAAAPAKEAASKDVKDGGKKTGVEVSTQQKLKDASSYLKPPSAELSKSSHVDVDSHREKEEINVEIRTKPIFGRRSKFSPKEHFLSSVGGEVQWVVPPRVDQSNKVEPDPPGLHHQSLDGSDESERALKNEHGNKAEASTVNSLRITTLLR